MDDIEKEYIRIAGYVPTLLQVALDSLGLKWKWKKKRRIEQKTKWREREKKKVSVRLTGSRALGAISPCCQIKIENYI